MIIVNVAVNNGRYYVDCSGHAMYAEKGKDIVCAGVSALCMALNSVVGSVAPEVCSLHSVNISDGAYSLDIHCEEDSDYDNMLKYSFRMFCFGLSLLEKQFPAHIRLRKGYYPEKGAYTDTSEQTMEKNERKKVKRRKKIDLQIFSAESAELGDTSENGGEGGSVSADVAETDSSSVSEKELSSEEEFEELIKGKYADAFRKRTQGIIDKRFAKMKSFERTAEVVAPLLESLGKKFPSVDKADTEGLIRAYLESEQAKTAEETKSKEHSAVFLLAEQHLKKRAAKDLSRKLSDESEKLREIYPSFDLKGEYTSSPEFRALLGAGVSLRRAYETVNLEKIMGSALRYAVLKAGKNAADALTAPGRVPENSLSDRASSVRRTDVKNLTEKEIMQILSEVSRGAKITF